MFGLAATGTSPLFNLELQAAHQVADGQTDKTQLIKHLIEEAR